MCEQNEFFAVNFCLFTNFYKQLYPEHWPHFIQARLLIESLGSTPDICSLLGQEQGEEIRLLCF